MHSSQAKRRSREKDGVSFRGPGTAFFDATFRGRADFFGAIFKGTTFHGAKFSSDAIFELATFRGGVRFSDAKFGGHSSFGSATFSMGADFDRATFCAHTRFYATIFDQDCSFREATFSEGADFGEAIFRGDADFKKSYFKNSVDFNSIFCGIINLDESKSYSMHFSESIFKNHSTISLKFSDFVRLEIRWKLIQDKIEYNGPAYLALVKNFNKLELFDDADECYYQYRTIRRREHLDGIIPKLLDYIAWIVYGYGVHPGNPLILSLGLFLISILVFAAGFGLQEPIGSMINATYLSVFVFTSSPKTDPLIGLYEIWGMIERIAGWLLMACFLVVLAKKTLR